MSIFTYQRTNWLKEIPNGRGSWCFRVPICLPCWSAFPQSVTMAKVAYGSS